MKCDHPVIIEWVVSMTSPEGKTGIEIEMCTACLLKLLYTPSVQVRGRTVHVSRKVER